MNPLKNATNFTRVFVGRYNSGSYPIAFEDRQSGYVLYINTPSNRVDSVYSYGHGIYRTNNTSQYTHGNPFIYTTYLDQNERNYTNADKAYYERNGVRYNHGSYGSLISPKDSDGHQNYSGEKDGMIVGSYYSSITQYAWNGDISEIIYFDDVLRGPEKEALNEWLNRKYGNTPICTLPADTTGYNVDNCNVGAHAYDDALTEGECSISCAAGYDFSRTQLPKATCSAAGEKFVLSGCYPITDDTTAVPSFVGTDNVGIGIRIMELMLMILEMFSAGHQGKIRTVTIIN